MVEEKGLIVNMRERENNQRLGRAQTELDHGEGGGKRGRGPREELHTQRSRASQETNRVYGNQEKQERSQEPRELVVKMAEIYREEKLGEMKLTKPLGGRGLG